MQPQMAKTPRWLLLKDDGTDVPALRADGRTISRR